MDFRLPLQVFEQLYKRERSARAKMRLHVLLLRREGYTQTEIASMVHVTQGTVSNICRRFVKEGFDSVHDKPRSGKPSKLSVYQKRELHAALQHEYVNGKVRRGWQTKDVTSLLHKRYGVLYSQRHVERILHNTGLSWKVPRPMHKNRDPIEVDTFKKSSDGRSRHWQTSTQ